MVAGIHAQIDELLVSIAELSTPAPAPGDSASGVSMVVVREVEAEVSRARNRLESARLRLGAVAKAEREAGRAKHLDEGQLFGSAGRMDGPSAARDGRLAEGLGNATPTPSSGGPHTPGHGAGGPGGPDAPGGPGGPGGPGVRVVLVALMPRVARVVGWCGRRWEWRLMLGCCPRSTWR
ncbi:hypothetical protein [Kytococcus sedentarius]|uniref:hypothetical protein n=1 Tax=Kytococcus sedentarius TaxID=1276 RepID=UPI001950DE95|nr:hypothetical protein [Kytococcus sedentarius]QRO87682.1 hypothetical protein I6J30_01470 [Kytococcus sedentarius]